LLARGGGVAATQGRTGGHARGNAGHFNPQRASAEMAQDPSIGYVRPRNLRERVRCSAANCRLARKARHVRGFGRARIHGVMSLARWCLVSANGLKLSPRAVLSPPSKTRSLRNGGSRCGDSVRTAENPRQRGSSVRDLGDEDHQRVAERKRTKPLLTALRTLASRSQTSPLPAR
jgi:hypothetical protein